jgi:hypothetical protein
LLNHLWCHFVYFRPDLLLLPEVVLIEILGNICLAELLTSVSRTCITLWNLISTTSYLWRNFDFHNELSFSEDSLCQILKHSRKFEIFNIPIGSVYHCCVSNIDFVFAREFQFSPRLQWLSLVDCPLSTLCFIKQIPNLEIVNFTGCKNLKDDDFIILKNCPGLEQIYFSFTDVKPQTILEIVRGKSLTVIDACGIDFKLCEIRNILSEVFGSLLSFSISLHDDLDIHSFNHNIRDYYIDCSFHIYLK